MAKDGTNRGSKRVRAGGKPTLAAEKIQNGRPVMVMSNDIPQLEPAELEAVDLPNGAILEGADMPRPAEYLSARQKNGVPLGVDKIYKDGLLGKHPTTGGVMVSPFVQMSQQFQRTSNLL